LERRSHSATHGGRKTKKGSRSTAAMMGLTSASDGDDGRQSKSAGGDPDGGYAGDSFEVDGPPGTGDAPYSAGGGGGGGAADEAPLPYVSPYSLPASQM
jgi:hypothetical protein